MRCFRILALAVLVAADGLAGEVYDPLRFGAQPDGRTLCTAAIQQAVDACAAAGGGTVRLAPGTWLSGTIFFRSGVTLQLDEGATLLGSTDLNHYPHKTSAFRSMTDEKQNVTQSLLYAERVQRIALCGRGQIDGQGASFGVPDRGPTLVGHPFLIRMIECDGVRIEGLTLRNSASWTQYYLACDNLAIRGIRVIGHVRRNNDGIDVDGCQNVEIRDVETTSDDDGLCFKGSSPRPTRNVVVEHCRFYSYCNALKHGTDSQGGFENVLIRDVELGQPAADVPPRILGAAEGIAGIALEVADGGVMRNVTIEDVRIRGTRAPLYLVLADRGRHLKDEPRLPPGRMQNVTLRRVRAETESNQGCPILGLPEHPIEDLTLADVQIAFPGGGTPADLVRRFDEQARSYPEAIKYAKRLPAFGLYGWHVKGLKLEGLQLSARRPDGRPAIALEDARDVTLDGQALDPAQASAGVQFLPLASPSPRPQ